MRGLKALMETMSEKIDRLTEQNRALRVRTPVPATQSSIDTWPKRNGRTSNPALAGEAAEDIPPTPSLIHSVHAGVETDPAMVRRMKGGRRLRGRAKEKKGMERMQGSVPSWAW